MSVKKKNVTKKTIYYNTEDDPEKESARRPVVLGEYYNVHQTGMSPVTQLFIDRLVKELVAWADIDEDGKESLRLNDFYNSKGITTGTWEDLINKHPRLHEAHDYAKERIASRREIGSSRRRYDNATIARTIGWYCGISRDEQRRIAELKNVEQGNARGTLIINMAAAPSTPDVPLLNNKESRETDQGVE